MIMIEECTHVATSNTEQTAPYYRGEVTDFKVIQKENAHAKIIRSNRDKKQWN